VIANRGRLGEQDGDYERIPTAEHSCRRGVTVLDMAASTYITVRVFRAAMMSMSHLTARTRDLHVAQWSAGSLCWDLAPLFKSVFGIWRRSRFERLKVRWPGSPTQTTDGVHNGKSLDSGR
jgi:hypothetical protein